MTTPPLPTTAEMRAVCADLKGKLWFPDDLSRLHALVMRHWPALVAMRDLLQEYALDHNTVDLICAHLSVEGDSPRTRRTNIAEKIDAMREALDSMRTCDACGTTYERAKRALCLCASNRLEAQLAAAKEEIERWKSFARSNGWEDQSE